MAIHFYNAWRTENQKCGIADYGHRREMKDDAARFIVEDYFAWRFEPGVRALFLWELGSKATDAEAFINIVRDLMSKPKARRDPPEDGWLELAATPNGLFTKTSAI